ncbi:uncharacterized protein LOC105694002 [Athalia rosae]|uniref:uncharacterized protein LOC105694002 n=1 Tax=Athalia rosae TaxID=37344 RepID=UPI0020333F44|nr:uncharacterized protein LOC105694002 [Athalia rosae]
MFCRFSLKHIFDKIQKDPFWAVTRFSWLFSHWTGSNLIFGIVFGATTIGLHLFSWLLIYTSYFNEYINRSQTALSRAVYCTTLFTHTLIVPVLITTWMIRGWKRVRRFASVIRTVDKRLTRVGITTRNAFVQMEWLAMVFAPLIGVVYFMRRAELPPSERGFEFSKSLLPLMKFYIYNHFLIGTYVPCFFAFFALVVHDRYRSINSLLENISGAEYGNKDIAGNEGRMTLAEWIAAVRELRALHRKLYFAAEKISQAFGLQILQLTVLTLGSVVSGFYNFHVANVFQCGMTKFDRRRIFLQAVIELGPICVAAYHGGRTIGQVILFSRRKNIRRILVCAEYMCFFFFVFFFFFFSSMPQARRTVNVLQDVGVSNDILRLEVRRIFRLVTRKSITSDEYLYSFSCSDFSVFSSADRLRSPFFGVRFLRHRLVVDSEDYRNRYDLFDHSDPNRQPARTLSEHFGLDGLFPKQFHEFLKYFIDVLTNHLLMSFFCFNARRSQKRCIMCIHNVGKSIISVLHDTPKLRKVKGQWYSYCERSFYSAYFSDHPVQR